jgi:hypothetical protein
MSRLRRTSSPASVRRLLGVLALGARALVAAALCLTGQALAAGEGSEEERRGTPNQPQYPWLSDRFGIEPLTSQLTAPRLQERLAAIQRLARLGTPPALHRLLASALERRAQLGAREWLTLVRALAPHGRDDEARVVLALAMTQRPAEVGGPAEAALFELARGTAALALAATGSESALRVLGASLRAGGAGARLAADALLEYPPSDLERLLAAPGEPSVELARWLGALGDQRAFHPLRAWVRGESAEVRAAAALALTELGALETVPLARQWLGSGVPVLERAALEILELTQQREAAPALERELARQSDSLEGWRRALQFPSAELLPLAQGGDAQGASWTLLGRIGGADAARALAAGLSRPGSAFAAAHALSRQPGSAAHGVLARALDERVALAVSSRAAALRTALWGERFAALPARLAELRAAKLPAERAAAAWGASLGGSGAALAELGSGDPARVEAAANNALWFDDVVFAGAGELLRSAPPGRARSAFVFALLHPSGRREVSSSLLESLVLEAGAAAPLALRVLASRSESRFESFAEAFLSHPDAVLRAHVARGLGESGRAAALGLLARSFEFEVDPSVRQAIVRGLSGRRGPTVEQTLKLAAGLDPDATVRAAAQLALSGVQLDDPAAGGEFLWAELRGSSAAQGEPAGGEAAPAAPATEPTPPTEPRAASEPGLLHVVPGLALPVFADAAGILVVAGVNAHPLSLRWR